MDITLKLFQMNIQINYLNFIDLKNFSIFIFIIKLKIFLIFNIYLKIFIIFVKIFYF
jgi:hypothetical protein